MLGERYFNRTIPWLKEEYLWVDDYPLTYFLTRYGQKLSVTVLLPGRREVPLESLVKEGRAIRLPAKWRAGNKMALQISFESQDDYTDETDETDETN